MSKVVSLKTKREGLEIRQLHEVTARVNHGVEHTRITLAKTLHKGVDLRKAIAKAQALQMQHLWSQDRLEFAIDERGDALVLARVGDSWRVLCCSDDFVPSMEEYEFKITATTQDGMLGVWEDVPELNDNSGGGEDDDAPEAG